MTNNARREVEVKLLGLLRQQSTGSMSAAELIRGATRDGIAEMDAREALLSLMVADDVELTADRRVRLDTEASF
jgi:hypothetical protein